MDLDVAMVWVDCLIFGHRLLGVWRAQLGPGPFSIFFRGEKGQVIEVWADGKGGLVGKVYERD